MTVAGPYHQPVNLGLLDNKTRSGTGEVEEGIIVLTTGIGDRESRGREEAKGGGPKS